MGGGGGGLLLFTVYGCKYMKHIIVLGEADADAEGIRKEAGLGAGGGEGQYCWAPLHGNNGGPDT